MMGFDAISAGAAALRARSRPRTVAAGSADRGSWCIKEYNDSELASILAYLREVIKP
jgi:hypothetical protein